MLRRARRAGAALRQWLFPPRELAAWHHACEIADTVPRYTPGEIVLDGYSLAYADLFVALESASARLGRKVAPTIYSSKELAKRVKQENAFVTRILAQPKLWLIGDENVLAA